MASINEQIAHAIASMDTRLLDLERAEPKMVAPGFNIITATIVVASNGIGNPFGVYASPGNFAGVFIVNETAADGHVAIFATGASGIIKVADVSGTYTTTINTASTHNVYLDGNLNVTIQNKRGASRTYNVMGFATRLGSN
jgi:hypothetical protein